MNIKMKSVDLNKHKKLGEFEELKEEVQQQNEIMKKSKEIEEKRKREKYGEE